MPDNTTVLQYASTEPTLRPDGTPHGHGVIGWLLTAVLFVLIACYVSMYCGNFANYISKYCSPAGSLIIKGRDVLSKLTRGHIERWLGMHVVLGFCIPAVLLMLTRRRLRDVGFCWPNPLGRRLVVASVLISIPFGIYLLRVLQIKPHSWETAWPWAIGLLAMVPEHFLICGVTVAVLLPERRLPEHVPLADPTGPWWRYGLRWLGLAQPGESALGWAGLTIESLAAITFSGVAFGIVHFGKEIPELILSFPGGVAVAYVTLRCGSIWPALIAHWTMNLVPATMILIYHWLR